MISHTVQFDEVASRIDAARGLARAGDPSAVLVGVREALAAIEGVPYAGLRAEAGAAAADAVESVRVGDRGRADAALALLAHLVADMERFERVETARLAARLLRSPGRGPSRPRRPAARSRW